jgi:hypothetical protein
VVSRGRPQVEWLVPLAPQTAGRAAPVAASSSRAPAPARVPAVLRLAVETAARVALPNAVAAAAVAVAPLGAEAAAGEAQPDAVAVAGEAQPDAVAAAEALPGVGAAAEVLPGAEAEAEEEPAVAEARGARDVPAGELPLGVAWVFRQDPVLPSEPPRSAPTARATGWSSVAWPSMRSWQAMLFSDVSCALGPAENSEAKS